MERPADPASAVAPTGAAPDVRPLLDITSGLWASQTLVAAESLELFTVLSRREGETPDGVAAALGIPERPAEMLLTACAALGLLEREGERFVPAPVAEHYLVRGRPYYIGDYIRMLRDYAYPGWMGITEAVRSDRPSRRIPEPDRGIFDTSNRPELFWEGMDQMSALTGNVFATEVGIGSSERLLDVGGGAAGFTIELCRRFPELRATVYDLPHVCQLATTRIRDAGMDDRITPCPGDFFADGELPGGHDLALLSMVLHDWAEEDGRAILAKCFRALPSGGRVAISELLVEDTKDGPLDAALMSMNMLVGTRGRNYTAAEYASWLRDAGFVSVRVVRFRAAGANGALLARKP
ncbi:ubiquinone/menaquinone biosynthesis C-methylase UbiE [Haloactinospora alba]|uniref:Ubiquinone/menaquinone biosynthesis C-methylase UbiE n=1 Tax=Haloactinospora alba TaxID=405555 RepID=A0A543N971_9ACTN|nr:methyltransferase [Haloactinospora alba]TQN28385.1 ubiquinone/menaquinone biosynthesis C-methylase UbiE [Haloactinospora alba]